MRWPGSILLAVLLAAVLATPAGAAWAPAELVSASDAEQSLLGVLPASVSVSADGSRVAFATRSRNLVPPADPPGEAVRGGVLQRELATGRLRLVARGLVQRRSDDTVIQLGARAPSQSNDGRYVAFTTDEALDPERDANDAFDVYVRDMTLDPRDPRAYTLASAVESTGRAPAYDGSGPGSEVTPRGALSGDGRRVAFLTTAGSDLPAGLSGTPAGQIFVRDLTSSDVTLVTVDRTTQGFAGGALADRGVALSADGSTVVWAGREAARQTRVLPGENAGSDAIELLWRRWADPGASTRRVSGAGDPEDPACGPQDDATSQDTVASPCDGPFAVSSGLGLMGTTPTVTLFAVSGDGRRVVFATNALLRANAVNEAKAPDAFVGDMRDGVSRKQGTRELTRAARSRSAGRNAGVENVGISSDGRHVAFNTQRITFILPRPTLVGVRSPAAEGSETYVADLESDTLELATRAFDRRQARGNEPATLLSAAPTLSHDGGVLGIASGATNLVRGDGNSAPDAFALHRLVEPSDRLDQDLPPPSPELQPAVPYRLRATVRRLADGTVHVVAIAPAAGSIEVRARRVGTKPALVARRTAAVAAAAERSDVLLRVPVRLRPRLARGIAVRITVRFRPRAGGTSLRKALRSTFRKAREER